MASALGSYTVQQVPPNFLKPLVVVMLVLVAVYTICKKDWGAESTYKGKTRKIAVLSALAAFGLGFYDGFFEPGTGAFLIFAFLMIGFDFVQAAGNAKVLNFASNIASNLTALMYGLKTTTASSAGFLTSTTVIFVPILQSLITRKMPELPIIAGVLVIVTGIGLLTIEDSFVIESGSILCLLGAFLYAVHIIVTSSFIHKTDALQLGIFQLGFAALYGLIVSFIFETPNLPSTTIIFMCNKVSEGFMDIGGKIYSIIKNDIM